MADTYGTELAVERQMFAQNIEGRLQVASNPYEGLYEEIPDARGRELQVVELINSHEALVDYPEDAPTPSVPSGNLGVYVRPIRVYDSFLVTRGTKIKTAVDYTSPKLREMAKAMARAKRNILRDAITGPRLLRNDGSALPVATAFDVNRTIAANYKPGGGGAATNLNVWKIIAGLEMLGLAENDLEGEVVSLSMSMKQNTSLFQDLQVTSRDYQSKARFEDKFVRSICGVNLVIDNSLAKTGSVRGCKMWVKSGLYYANFEPLWTDLGEDRSVQSQVRGQAEFWGGAVRSEDEKVVLINCDETGY